MDKSGVVRVKIKGDNERDSATDTTLVPFIFVGTKENIGNARILLEYHLAHLKVSPQVFMSLLKMYRLCLFALFVRKNSEQIYLSSKHCYIT